MKNLWSLLSFLVFLPAFTVAVIEINNIELYKPCIVDSTACPEDHACIQYFCYPKGASEVDPLKSCKKNSHCDGWKPDKTEKCFKEGQNGVCIAAEDYEMCETHDECEGRGGKCCGDYCCNEEYFDALQTQECTEGDEACEEVQTVMFSQEMESLACESNEACEAKHEGHVCCEDNLLLINLTLTDELLNWEGDRRCCMSSEGIRQVEQIEGLTDADYNSISSRIFEFDDKRDFCKGLLPALAEDLQTCVDEAEAEAEEARTAIAEAALGEAIKFAEIAATARLAAETAGVSANTTSDSKAAQGFANDAAKAADNAQSAANSSNKASEDASDAESAGTAAVDAQEASDNAQNDADAAFDAAEDAANRVEELKEIEADAAAAAEEQRLNEIELNKNKPKKQVTDAATNIQVSMMSVISATVFYSLLH